MRERAVVFTVLLAIVSSTLVGAAGPPVPAGAPVFQFIFPMGGGTYTGGTQTMLFWNVTHGADLDIYLTIRYSIDGGASFPYLITAGWFPTGLSMWWWSVPFLDVTSMRARYCATAADGSRGCAETDQDTRITSTPPYLSLLSPSGGAQAVPLGEPVVIGISTGIDVSTVSHTLAPSTVVSPTWSPDMRSLTLTPAPQWEPCTTYAATFAANDTLGNPVGPYNLSFATACEPVISATAPADRATGIPVTAPIAVRFTDPMDPSSVTWTINGGVSLQGVWSEDDTFLTLTHAADFTPCMGYGLRVDGRGRDASPLRAGPVPNPWSFTTACSPPVITATAPADGAVDVNVTDAIVVTFSETVNRSSVVIEVSPAVPLDVAWDGTSTVATAVPVGMRRTATGNIGIVDDPFPGGDFNEWLCRQRPPNVVAFDVPPGTVALQARLTSNASDVDLGLWRDENGNDTCDFGVDTFVAASTTATAEESVVVPSPAAGRYLAQVGPFTVFPGAVFDLEITLHARTPLSECTAYTVSVPAAKDTEGADLVPGPTPNPFSFTTACEVGVPRGLTIQAVPPDSVRLSWAPVSGATGYRVYESPNRFAAFPWSVLGETATTSFDAPHLADRATHYYIVRALNGSLEGGNSSMGVKVDLPFGFTAGSTNVVWFSLPYISAYRRASDIAGELGPGKIDVIGRWDAQWQTSTVYYYARGGWRGTDFPINPGDGLYVGTTSSFRWPIVGTDRAVVHSFERDAAPPRNVAWVSLPYTSSYQRASDVVFAIEGSLGYGARTHITEVGKWDASTQSVVVYQSITQWTGADFEIAPGDGVYVRVVTPFDWRPDLLVPEVP